MRAVLSACPLSIAAEGVKLRKHPGILLALELADQGLGALSSASKLDKGSRGGRGCCERPLARHPESMLPAANANLARAILDAVGALSPTGSQLKL